MNNKNIYELALNIQSELGKNDWNECYHRAITKGIDISSPNACKKAYQRHCKAIGIGSSKSEQIANASLRLTEERKKLNLLRPTVDTRAREYSEKSVISETIMNVWGKEPYHEAEIQVFVQPKSNELHGYAFGDVHWGYTNTHPKMTYSVEIAKKRLWEIANKIVIDVLKNGYKEIFIADLGDQIEGSGLRISQLLRIVETMTQQAKGYSDEIISIIKWISNRLPEVSIKFLMVSDDNHGQLRLFNTKRDEMPDNLSVLITNAVKNTIDTAHEYNGMPNVEFITADEIVMSVGTQDKPYNICCAHSHQYGRGDDILHKATQRHSMNIHLFIGAHWHTFSVKAKNVVDGCQTELIFIPPVVGDTDFSDSLFLSTLAGFAKITIDLSNRVSNAELIRLTQ